MKLKRNLVAGLVAGGNDRVPSFGLQTTGLGIREGTGALYAHHGMNERRKRFVSGDRVVLDGSLGLRSPQRIGWYVDLSERVFLATRHHRDVE